MISALELNITAKRLTLLMSSLKHARPSGNASMDRTSLPVFAGAKGRSELFVIGRSSPSPTGKSPAGACVLGQMITTHCRNTPFLDFLIIVTSNSRLPHGRRDLGVYQRCCVVGR